MRIRTLLRGFLRHRLPLIMWIPGNHLRHVLREGKVREQEERVGCLRLLDVECLCGGAEDRTLLLLSPAPAPDSRT